MAQLQFMDASLVIVRPKQPFIDWINTTYPDSIVTIDTYHDECGPHTYIIPDFDEPSLAKRWLKKNYLSIFEEAISGWSTNENDWPEDMTFTLFSKWFETEINLMVFDLRSKPNG